LSKHRKKKKKRNLSSKGLNIWALCKPCLYLLTRHPAGTNSSNRKGDFFTASSFCVDIKAYTAVHKCSRGYCTASF